MQDSDKPDSQRSQTEFSVECPCCKSTLVVNADLKSVIHVQQPKSEPKDFADFLKKDGERLKDLESRFKQTKEQEDRRSDLLEKKWEWAKKNSDKLPPAAPGIQWD